MSVLYHCMLLLSEGDQTILSCVIKFLFQQYYNY